MRQTGRFLLIRLFLVCASLLICEVALRALGFTPWATSYVPSDASRPTNLHPKYGWFNTAGAKFGTRDLQIGSSPILKNGNRSVTALQTNSEQPSILMLGDSLIFGAGLPDSQTLGWLLQERLPREQIANYGVSGFSTYQSLLLFRDLLDQKQIKPSTVLYGFGSHLEERNVGGHNWQWSSALHSRHANSYLPRVELDTSGNLREISSTSYYPEWPLRYRSSLVTLLEELYTRIFLAPDESTKREVTMKLLEEFNSEARARNSRFVVLQLWDQADARKEYANFFRNANIQFIDCVYPNYLDPDFRVPGDGHPNNIVQQYWLQCILNVL